MQKLITKTDLRALRPYLSALAWLFLLGLLANLVSLSFPLLLKTIAEAVEHDLHWESHSYLFFLVAGAALLGFFVSAFRDWRIAAVSARFEKEVTSSVIDRLLTIPFASLRHRAQGDWLTTIRQVQDLKWLVGQAGSQAFFDLFLIVGYAGILFYYDWATGLVYLALLATVTITMKLLGRAIYRRIDQAFADSAEADTRVVESLRNSLQVRSFHLAAWSRGRWSAPFYRYVENMRTADYLGSLLTSVFDLIHRAFPLIFFAWKLPAVSRGEMSLGTLLALSSTLSIGFDPLIRITAASSHLQKGVRALRSLRDIWSEHAESVGALPSSAGEPLVVPIAASLRGINFSYGCESGQRVLHDINLEVEAGEILGLAGPSGAGKSTLLTLLLGLYRPTSGTICIGGQNIEDIPRPLLRRWVGLVEQEVRLFDGTLSENIALGDPHPKEDVIWECLELANAAEFVRDLPKGIHSIVGEGENGLSVGQKQRLALARALYWNPRLLLLDEPTSALDPASEKEISLSLDRIRRHRTIVLSAHRPETLRACDRLIVLERGKLICDRDPIIRGEARVQ